jgi:hypothetical protein
MSSDAHKEDVRITHAYTNGFIDRREWLRLKSENHARQMPAGTRCGCGICNEYRRISRPVAED